MQIELNEHEKEISIWRYMPFSRFVSLLTFQALWFSKLKIFEDRYEGRIPSVIKEKMNLENQKWKEIFISSKDHKQIDEWNEKNEKSARDMIIASCWFINEEESDVMWMKYSSLEEGVAIRTSPLLLSRYLNVWDREDFTFMRKVKYVDFETYDMDIYPASQAFERAFIKDVSLSHENELRIVTLNCITSNYINPHTGICFTKEEVKQRNGNNPDYDGVYIQLFLSQALKEIRVSPKSSDYFYLLVKRMVEIKKIQTIVNKSSLR